MLKHTTATLFVVLVLTLIGFAAIGSYAPSYQSCEAEDKSQQIADKQPDYYEVMADRFFTCQGKFLDANNGTITGIATAFLTVVTIGLMLLAGEQSRTSRAELRAYISATPIHISSFDSAHRPIVKIRLRNHGRTPAKSLRHRIEVGVLPEPVQPGMSLPAPLSRFSNPTVLFPDAELDGERTRDNGFTISEIADIRNSTVRIYVYGEVEYFDVFRERRETKFCSALVADSATLAKLASNYKKPDLKVTFQIAPMGNDAE